MSSDSEHLGKLIQTFFQRPDIPARKPGRKENATATSVHRNGTHVQLTIDETVEALSKWDKCVLELIYHFEHDPYPSVEEKIKGIDEPISPRPMSVSPVPEYVVAGVLWPHDPRSSFRALLKFGLVEQPQSCNHCSVHCYLPDRRKLLVDYKGGAFDPRRPHETSFDVTVYIDGLDRIGRHGMNDLRYPNSYTLTSTGIFVARKMFGSETGTPQSSETSSGSSRGGPIAAAPAEERVQLIEQLEKSTPQFDPDNGQWVRNSLAAKLEHVKTRSLANYRSVGISNKAKDIGKDLHGRIWRRPGMRHSHPWYLRSTLRNAK